MKERLHLGIVMGRGNSTRLPYKNRQLVAGKPLIEHSANTLKLSGMFERVVLSTDCESMARLAEPVASIDETIVRDPSWNDSERVASSIPYIVEMLQERDNIRYDSVTFIAANVLFIGPSWCRVALDILFNYNYLDDVISQVTVNKEHVHIACCRINPHGDTIPVVYELAHSGIMVDIDYPWDLELARQIAEAVEFPLTETIHEQVFADLKHNHNFMRGLTRR